MYVILAHIYNLTIQLNISFTQEEVMAWMESIRKSISKDPFYAQMQARKKNAMCKQWRNELT